MHTWTVDFETYSRDDVMKVCALLAKGIGQDTVADRRVRIFITGSFNSGKTAITDGVLAALMDGTQSYKLPTQPLIEKFQGQATDGCVFKDFLAGGKKCFVTLGRHEFATRDGFLTELFYNKTIMKRKGGLDFMTTVFREPPKSSDIHIDYNDPHEAKVFGPDWDRSWSISIKSKALKTAQMAEILDHLHSFHVRRQARHVLSLN